MYSTDDAVHPGHQQRKQRHGGIHQAVVCDTLVAWHACTLRHLVVTRYVLVMHDGHAACALMLL
jgi:hypothetical protein